MDDFMERARAEAEKRWPRKIKPTAPVEWLDEGMASGFVLGALWAARSDLWPCPDMQLIIETDKELGCG